MRKYFLSVLLALIMSGVLGAAEPPASPAARPDERTRASRLWPSLPEPDAIKAMLVEAIKGDDKSRAQAIGKLGRLVYIAGRIDQPVGDARNTPKADKHPKKAEAAWVTKALVIFHKALDDSSRKIQTAAMTAVAHAGQRGRGAGVQLERILLDNDAPRFNRLVAARTLKKIDPSRLWKILDDVKTPPQPIVFLLHQLRSTRGKVVPTAAQTKTLRRLYEHTDPAIQATALAVLLRPVEIDNWTKQRAREALNSKDPARRGIALSALPRIASPSERSAFLIKAIADPNRNIRRQAVHTLRVLSPEERALIVRRSLENADASRWKLLTPFVDDLSATDARRLILRRLDTDSTAPRHIAAELAKLDRTLAMDLANRLQRHNDIDIRWAVVRYVGLQPRSEERNRLLLAMTRDKNGRIATAANLHLQRGTRHAPRATTDGLGEWRRRMTTELTDDGLFLHAFLYHPNVTPWPGRSGREVEFEAVASRVDRDQAVAAIAFTLTDPKHRPLHTAHMIWLTARFEALDTATGWRPRVDALVNSLLAKQRFLEKKDIATEHLRAMALLGLRDKEVIAHCTDTASIVWRAIDTIEDNYASDHVRRRVKWHLLQTWWLVGDDARLRDLKKTGHTTLDSELHYLLAHSKLRAELKAANPNTRQAGLAYHLLTRSGQSGERDLLGFWWPTVELVAEATRSQRGVAMRSALRVLGKEEKTEPKGAKRFNAMKLTAWNWIEQFADGLTNTEKRQRETLQKAARPTKQK